MLRKFKSVLELTAVTLFAAECLQCRRLIQSCSPFCEACKKLPPLTPPYCRKCGISLSQSLGECGHCEELKLRYLDRVQSLFWLNESASLLLHGIKYQGQIGYLNFLKREIAAVGLPLFSGKTCFVPVPLSSAKWLHRGFNQAYEIARWLEHLSGIGVVEGLHKKRETLPQSTLGKAERRKNLKDAFCWREATPVPKGVLLIDDVFTTGQTLDACAGVLKDAGAQRVEALTVFRAAPRAV